MVQMQTGAQGTIEGLGGELFGKFSQAINPQSMYFKIQAYKQFLEMAKMMYAKAKRLKNPEKVHKEAKRIVEFCEPIMNVTRETLVNADAHIAELKKDEVKNAAEIYKYTTERKQLQAELDRMEQIHKYYSKMAEVDKTTGEWTSKAEKACKEFTKQVGNREQVDKDFKEVEDIMKEQQGRVKEMYEKGEMSQEDWEKHQKMLEEFDRDIENRFNMQERALQEGVVNVDGNKAQGMAHTEIGADGTARVYGGQFKDGSIGTVLGETLDKMDKNMPDDAVLNTVENMTKSNSRYYRCITDPPVHGGWHAKIHRGERGEIKSMLVANREVAVKIDEKVFNSEGKEFESIIGKTQLNQGQLDELNQAYDKVLQARKEVEKASQNLGKGENGTSVRGLIASSKHLAIQEEEFIRVASKMKIDPQAATKITSVKVAKLTQQVRGPI